MAHAPRPDTVAAVRRFNRFYTRRIGLLNGALVGADFSLPEMRVLWELAHGADVTATALRRGLGMDGGQLSRMLRSLRERGLVKTVASRSDGRVRHLELTARGHKAFAPLEQRQDDEVSKVLAGIPADDHARLVGAMDSIETLLDAKPREPGAFVIREPRPGDYGWVVHRHGALYAQEYGWDASFEALVAEIVAKFIREYQPRREHCWIAESRGGIAGCVFLVERSARVAQLRLLLVEPSARGLGIGSALVSECIRFARAAGYRKMMLWTNDILHAARHIYQRAGFQLVEQEKHTSFGHRLVGQNWELPL